MIQRTTSIQLLCLSAAALQCSGFAPSSSHLAAHNAMSVVARPVGHRSAAVASKKSAAPGALHMAVEGDFDPDAINRQVEEAQLELER